MTHHPDNRRNSIQFIDLAAQAAIIAPEVEASIKRVLAHGQYVMGPEVKALEDGLAQFCGAREVISCANGTDALGLVLMAKGVGSGDAVFCPTFTFAATAEVVAWTGATPVLVDVLPDTFNLDPESLKSGIAVAKRAGLHPAAVIPVDLFGQPADYTSIEPVCEEHGLWMLCDAAQSFGASYRNRKVGTIGLATSTSFFPAKPLGCYGDGGAVFTDDTELAAIMRSIRVHGQGEDKYDNVRIGLNARLDTIQAAVLIEKLKIFANEIMNRNAIVSRYSALLKDVAIVPTVLDDCTSVWAQYTIRVSANARERVASDLRRQGIPTAIYYPKCLHQQTAYRDYPVADDLAQAERVANEVISLPMHPYLKPSVQDLIIEAVRNSLAAA